MDCGATCLRMVARWYGRFYGIDYLRDLTFVGKEGVNLLDISDAAEKIGFNTLSAKITYDRLADGLPMPLIAHWRQNHFIVVYEVTPHYVRIADPAAGKYKISKAEFLDGWGSDMRDGEQVGIVLLLETAPEFYSREGEKVDKSSFRFLWTYLKRYNGLLRQLTLGLLVGSLIQVIAPFLTQAVVDVGINNQDLDFVWLILMAQLALFLGQTSMEFIRGWILLHVGTRVNMSLISDFLIKLMKLPVKFFDSKLTGDLIQRINDNHRVEHFLTSTAIFTLFSVVNFVVFNCVLLFYNIKIAGIYLGFTVIYIVYVTFFLKKRKELDYRRFDQMSENQSNLIQLIGGMQDIKIHNAERQKRWQWERIQAKLFRVSVDFLALEQYQRAGGFFINELKNILVTFIAARAVIKGELTVGQMLAVEYIIGQLNSPLEQIVHFLQAAQDAKTSLERLDEIHQRDDEENSQPKMLFVPETGNLAFERVTFQYGSVHSPKVLNNLSLTVERGKTTAIVGSSGSGKTTLLRLLLGFYAPTEGILRVGDVHLNSILQKIWRERVGVVMQDGFIFSESIAKNIALGDEVIDRKRLLNAVKIANIQSFVETLPLGYNTKIGDDGVGLSQGQKQRLLIARAVYKNPDFIFFDEATNALDAYNEFVIMDNLEEFCRGKTVVVVAHRLSTVKNADKIVVLEKGEIIEEGTHNQLVAQRGAYYSLVKNQLELGS